MNAEAQPGILDCLRDGLEQTVATICETWRPDDPAYRADFYRQVMMNLSYAYFAHFHADAEHPDWAPLWNPVYTDQPNPDDIYLYCPIRGDLSYRISGSRGTCAMLTFTTQHGWLGLNEYDELSGNSDFDDRDLVIRPDGTFELILSARRPSGDVANWARIASNATALVVRYRMVDWEREVDPQLSIECLDPVPPKPRLMPDAIFARIRAMSLLPLRYNTAFLPMQNDVKAQVGINVFTQTRYAAGLTRQIYWPAVFELEDDEALIIETEMPARRHYWNIQLNDPYFNAVEYVYHLSSINEATAHFSSDGRFRAVVALTDPGVPNWLDPAGFKQGTIYGRWYDCDPNPLPTITRVKLAELRAHLPRDTPAVTPRQRAEQIARRVRAVQRRRRW
ncbi:MAG: hypothetical protein N2423_03085 [Novosphingobium sp.]|nr:hypothetical protein [Novosphingobium sp.]